EHVGIDERTAAQPRAQHRVDLVVGADVEHPVQLPPGNMRWARAILGWQVPEILRHRVRRARERAERVAFAAFEHEHAPGPFLRRAARQDCAAEPRPDYRHLEGHLRPLLSRNRLTARSQQTSYTTCFRPSEKSENNHVWY